MRRLVPLSILCLCLFFNSKLSAQCTNGSQYPTGSVALPTNTTVVTISTCNYTSEYSELTGAVSGETYEFSCNLGGTHKYVTITDLSNAVLAHGMSPFTWNSGFTGDIRAHWTDDAACNSTSSCHTTTVECTSCGPPPPPPTGSLCTDPIIVGSLPYTTTDDTNGYGDDYSSADEPCSNSGYLGGDDVVYMYTPSSNMNVDITLTGTGTWVGLFVYSDCPFATCVDSDTQSGGNPSITDLALTSGTSYYIVISTWPSPQSTAYTLDIIEKTCTAGTTANPLISFADCPTSTSILFDVTSMGDATSYTVTNDVGGTNPPPITMTGTGFEVSDLPTSGTVTITLAHNSDSNCDIVLGPYLLACPPTNDVCADAEDVTGSINAGPFDPMELDNTYAADGTNPFTVTGCNTFNSWCNTNPAYRDIWYKITPTVTGCFGFLSVSTLSSTFDTKISIMEGSCAGTTISGNDDYHGFAGDYTSFATACVQNGMDYFVQVAGYSSTSTGDIKLDIELIDITDAVGHNAGNVTADFECTGSDGWTHYINTTNGQVLLSVEKNGEDIGWLPMSGNTCEVESGSVAQNLGAMGCQSFYATADYWFVMNRTWDLSPSTQPANPVNIRSYYTPTDLTDLNTGLTGAGLPTVADGTMVHYKINNGDEENLVSNACQASGTAANYGEIYSFSNGTCGTSTYAQYPVSSFSGGGGGGGGGGNGGALPIELINFSAKAVGEINEISWSTLSEYNNEFQIIERSADGHTNWTEIATELGRGGIDIKVDYKVLDRDPLEMSYYRLKAVDFDGATEYSSIVSVKRSEGIATDAQIISAHPNPTQDIVNVYLTQAIDQTFTLTVKDLTGRVVDVTVEQRNGQDIVIGMANAAPGVYFASFKAGDFEETIQIVKQ